MEITIVIVLLFIGIILFLVELFLIPGISIAGIAGTIFMGGAVYYAYANMSSTAGHITLFGSFILLAVVITIFLKSNALDRMALKTNITGKNDPLEKIIINVGDTGIASSRLAPMGKVKINGNIVEAKTNGEFIDQGTEVRVMKVFNTNILVERIV
ncbi:MAG: hypothetical protein GZ091_13575 [Paludibacter sp.]|nr:hypothetical protein [Paludibacter sp.]